MSEQPISPAPKTITVGTALGWVFGVLFTLAALGSFTSNQPVPGALLAGCAILALPPVMRLVARQGGIAFSGGLRLAMIIGLLVVFVVTLPHPRVGEATSSAAPPPADTTSSDAAAPAQQTSAPAAAKTLLDIQGTGTKSTEKFTTQGNDWDLQYSYDCSGFGVQGNFIVTVKGGDGSDTGMLVNQLGMKGDDTDHYHTGGTFYLEINSECAWHIVATG